MTWRRCWTTEANGFINAGTRLRDPSRCTVRQATGRNGWQQGCCKGKRWSRAQHGRTGCAHCIRNCKSAPRPFWQRRQRSRSATDPKTRAPDAVSGGIEGFCEVTWCAVNL